MSSPPASPAAIGGKFLVAVAAVGIFVWLGLQAERAPIHFDPLWMAILSVATLALLVVCGMLLWRRTRFS